MIIEKGCQYMQGLPMNNINGETEPHIGQESDAGECLHQTASIYNSRSLMDFVY